MQVIAPDDDYSGPERRKTAPMTIDSHAAICTIKTVDERINSIYGRLDDGQACMAALKLASDQNAVRMERVETLQCDLALKIEAMGRSDTERVAEVDKRLDAQDAMLRENTTATMQLVDILKAGEGFFRVVGWGVSAAKWIASIVFAIASVWFLFKDHK